MSNEEMNKKMEFIVEQRAQFAADIQVMREIQAQDTKTLKEQDRKLSDALIAMAGMVGNLTQGLTNLTQAQTQTDENIKLLTAAQARTDERLNIFINVVERYISGNGGSVSPA